MVRRPTLAERAASLRTALGFKARYGQPQYASLSDLQLVQTAASNAGHGRDSGFGAGVIRDAKLVEAALIGAPSGYGPVFNTEGNVDEFGDFSEFDQGGFDGDFSGGDVVIGDSSGDFSGFVTPAMSVVRGLGGWASPMGAAAGGAAVTAAGAGVAMAARTLWGALRKLGGAGASFAINGVRGKMADLWPAVRQYGPAAVATALGIGAAELGQLLMQAPTGGGRRRRRRGISAANIRTAKRVIRFNKQLSRQLGTYSGSRRGYRRGRRPRWVRVDGY